MARYSVATTKDNLSSLIDKALAGEEVIITRHGKPTVTLRAVEPATLPKLTNAEWMEKLTAARLARSARDIDGAELVRQMREDSAH